jgi:hypothetical protein
MSAHSKAAAKKAVIEFSSILMQDCLAEGGLNLPPQAGPALWGLGWAPGYLIAALGGNNSKYFEFFWRLADEPPELSAGLGGSPAATLHAAEPPEFLYRTRIMRSFYLIDPTAHPSAQRFHQRKPPGQFGD